MARRPRLIPSTLFGQTVAILLAGLVVSALLGMVILAFNQAAVIRNLGAFAATQRIVNLVRLIDNAPPDWRGRLAAAASDETLLVTVSTNRPSWATDEASGPGARTVREFLTEQLPAALAKTLHVAVAAPPHEVAAQRTMMTMMVAGMPSMRGMPMMDGIGMRGMVAWRQMRTAVRLADGSWVAFAVALPPGGFNLSWPFLVALLAMTAIVIPASIWAVRRVTAPLRTLVHAAERLGRDVAAPSLAEVGSLETRQAAHAFNLMQTRVRQLVETRTRMLAALSHDLRTSLTLLRLRVEETPDSAERGRMLATIEAMNEMIDGTLRFARDDTAAEPRRSVDLTALLAAIVADLADAGLKVTMNPAAPAVVTCRPAALRRALANLLDNAVKYAGSAEVAIATDEHSVTVTIDDNGPGIPEAELSNIFEPFYRLEQSRNRETGGSGLGLAITLAIIEANGGTIRLANRAGGGLSAQVILPR